MKQRVSCWPWLVAVLLLVPGADALARDDESASEPTRAASERAATGMSERSRHPDASRSEPDEDARASRVRERQRRRHRRRRRVAWCERYRPLLDGEMRYDELPFVARFAGHALSLGELEDEFSALRGTPRHHVYQAWKRYRHRIRAAELDRHPGSPHYESYTGFIMGDPEILALGRQLEAVQRSMEERGQGRTFRELLAILEGSRHDLLPIYDARRDRRLETVVSRYHPTPTEMEGGCTDAKTMPLFTLDAFLAGEAPYVSIALDQELYESGAVRYGDEFRMPALDQRYRRQLDALGLRHILFRAVDTGQGFTGQGFARLDLCVSTEHYDTRYDDGGTTIGAVELVKVYRRTRVDGVIE